MKTQYENSKMMIAFAKEQYPKNAMLLEAIINLTTLSRCRQIALTGKMGEYNPTLVISDLIQFAAYNMHNAKTETQKAIFVLNHIGQTNFEVPKGTPKDWIELLDQATASKDAVHKSCFRYMRDEAERGVHVGKTQESPDVKEKVVTANQYSDAIFAHGFDKETRNELMLRIAESEKLTTTMLYLDIKKLGLKSDKFAFMKELDDNFKVIPGPDGKGFKNNGFKILPIDYMIFGSSIINVDLFSNDLNKVEAAIKQLTSPAFEYTESNGGKTYPTEIEGWKALAKDYMPPAIAKEFGELLDQNLAKGMEHLKILQNKDLAVQKYKDTMSEFPIS